MLVKTEYKIPLSLIDECLEVINRSKQLILNKPTGDFFYDPWQIKEEYKNSVWENLLNSLPIDIGQARIINLQSGTCYFKHADIDDRYHLNLSGDCGYLIDLENEKLYNLEADGFWYDMNAGILHSAVSFGKFDRSQIVVRKLLNRSNIDDPVMISITSNSSYPRYDFDNLISPWLNLSNKNKTITDFNYDFELMKVSFKIGKKDINNLIKNLPKEFLLEYE
jgi:hypothetical protein